VLDFGLAKFVGEAESARLQNPNSRLNGSRPGLVMGTVPYMSPEQARGMIVDARTDIWAFGCVLYEMLTGCQAFTGKSTTEVIAKIVEGSPDWDLLPAATPHATRMLIEAALNKDPQQRLQHIGDTRVFLNHRRSITVKPAANRTWGWKSSAAVVVILLGTLLRFQITAPGIRNPSLTVSPDGQHIAYVAATAGRPPSIWIRASGAVTAEPLSGTENAGNGLFWSPDGDYLGFFAEGKLKTVSVAGGPPKVLTNADTWAVNSPVAWNRDGVLLMAAHFTGLTPGLYRHSERDGPPVRVTNPDPTRGESGHFYPQFLPDGRHFLYYAPTAIDGGVGAAGGGAVYVASMDSTQTVHLMDIGAQPLSDAPPIYVEPGYLLFGRNRTLMAQRFDARKLALVGDAIAIAEQVIGRSFSASATVLAYRTATLGTISDSSALNELSWFDRKGKRIGQAGPPGWYGMLDVSPNGRRLAVERSEDSNRDITVIDLERNISSRLTFDAAVDRAPVFTSDGSRIIFSSGRAGSNNLGYNLFQRAADGSGADQLLFSGDHGELVFPEDVSSDGRYLVFTRYRSSFDLWVMPLSGGGKPFLYREAADGAQVSPDGRWLAYHTRESGIHQVYIQTFPDPSAGRWQVSSKGGLAPKWRSDGKELYFLALDGQFMAVPVKADNSLEFDAPSPLFQTQHVPLPPSTISVPPRDFDRLYDVTPDGQRFLMITPVPSSGVGSVKATDSAPITVIVNWTSALNRQ
jgi:Tol biopolymer transport system component